jgi:ferredoxin
MRVSVDAELCQGHARCCDICSECAITLTLH